MLRKLLGAAAVALSIGVAPQANAVPIELALVLDASGSISGANWDLQRDAYAGALAAVLPADGTIAVSVIRFANTATVVRPMTVINNAADLAALSTFFTTLSQSGNGSSTCISCGIIQAEGTFTGTATVRSVIDVSTDGEWNTGVNPAGPAGTAGTSAWAVANDADVVNALGIGTATAPNFASGPGSFSLLAPNFAAFQSTLETKLRRETGGGTTPEPQTLALLAMVAMIGAYTLKKRRA